jgi:hypothetical protein
LLEAPVEGECDAFSSLAKAGEMARLRQAAAANSAVVANAVTGRNALRCSMLCKACSDAGPDSKAASCMRDLLVIKLITLFEKNKIEPV